MTGRHRRPVSRPGDALALHGVDGLSVAAASVFALIPSVDPAITTMMVG